MPSLSELLANATAKELRIICAALTPFQAGKNPPQVLMLDVNDRKADAILSKYNIIQLINGIEVINPDIKQEIGEIVMSTAYDARGNPRFIRYIKPSKEAVDLADSTNRKSLGDNVIGLGSPFDAITALAISKTSSESIDSLNRRLTKSFKFNQSGMILPSDGTIIAEAVKVTDPDDPTGEKIETIRFLKYDPEATKKWRKIYEENGLDPNTVIPQWSLYDPFETTPIGSYTGFGARTAVMGNFNAKNVQNVEFDDRTNFSNMSAVSPVASFSGHAHSLEKTKVGEYGSSVTLIQLNSIAIKLTNAAGVIGDPGGFELALTGTWGGFNHTLKDKLVAIRSIYNNVSGLYNLIHGLYTMFIDKDTEKGLEEISHGIYYLKKEYVFAPFVNMVSEAIGSSITTGTYTRVSPYATNNYSSAKGKVVNLSTSDVEFLRKRLKPKKFEELFGKYVKNPGGATRNIKWRAKKKIHQLRRSTRVSRISGLVGLGISTIEYLFLEKWKEEIENREHREERIKGALNAKTSQKEISYQTGNHILIDEENVTVRNPIDGTNIITKLPRALVPTDASSFTYGGAPITEPAIDVLVPPDTVEPEDPGFFGNIWNGIKAAFVYGVEAIEIAYEKLPANNVVRLYIDTAIKTPQFLLGLLSHKAQEAIIESTVVKSVSNIKIATDAATGAVKTIGGQIAKAAEASAEFGVKITTGTVGRIFNVVLMSLTDPTPIGIASDPIRGKAKIIEGLEQIISEGKDEDGNPLDREDVERIERQIYQLKLGVKIQENQKVTPLIPENKCPNLNSNLNLIPEVENAKAGFENYSNIVTNLYQIGLQLNNNKSAFPNVDLTKINKDVNFVTNVNTPSQILIPQRGGPAGSCFPEYTNIKTKNGYKKISEFKCGEEIISFNHEGELETDVVSHTFIHENKEIYRYELENGVFLDITKEHPVLTDKNTFEEIGNLNIEDFLVDSEMNFVKIKNITFLKIGTVYNLEVEKNHTYIAENIRVHNKLGIQRDQQTLRENGLQYFLFQSDAENRELDYLNWVNDNFPGVLKFGVPYVAETGPGSPGWRFGVDQRPIYRVSSPGPSGNKGTNLPPYAKNDSVYENSAVGKDGNTVPTSLEGPPPGGSGEGVEVNFAIFIKKP